MMGKESAEKENGLLRLVLSVLRLASKVSLFHIHNYEVE